MSKIGKISIQIPEKVKVLLSGTNINIEGPLGKKSLNIDLEMFDLRELKLMFLDPTDLIINNINKYLYSNKAIKFIFS